MTVTDVIAEPDGSERGAILDHWTPTGYEYRYLLWRTIPAALDGNGGTLLWVMLNPSTADAMSDDHTLRCISRLTAREGFSRLEVVNLFALRSTDPKALLDHPNPVGPTNDAHLHAAANRADRVVVAWGALHARWKHRAEQTASILYLRHPQLWAFGTTLGGHPRHPSRLHTDARLVPWSG